MTGDGVPGIEVHQGRLLGPADLLAVFAETSFATFDQLGALRYGSDVMHVHGGRTAPHGLATIGYDDEGVEAQTFPIVEGGIFTGYQTDRQIAAEQGLNRSNGCGFGQSALKTPLQRMANISLAPAPPDGPTTEDLVSMVDRGICVVGDGGWSMDMERQNFQFTGQRYFKIEYGQLKDEIILRARLPTARVDDPVKKPTGPRLDRVHQYLLGRTGFHDHSLVEVADGVGHLSGETHLMGGHQNGHPLFFELTDQAQNFAHQLRVEGAGYLVEEEQAGLVGQRSRYRGSLRLAAGQTVREIICLIGQADPVQQLHSPRPGLRRRHSLHLAGGERDIVQH
jgi:hypothetical protein